MKNKKKTITDAERQAYIDGELEESRILEIEAYLAENPWLYEKIHSYKEINNDLHTLFDPVLNEPVPEHLISLAKKISRPRRFYTFFRAAAVAGLMLISGFSGWAIRGLQPGLHETKTLAQEHLVKPAAFAHYVYSTDMNYPVEFGADKKDKMEEWISERMHADIHPPSLKNQGFELVGGRLLPSTNRMAAQFMYQSADGQRITMYVRRGVWDNTQTSFQFRESEGVGVFYWIDGQFGYAVSGNMGKDQLINIAKAVRLEYQNPG